MVLSELKKKGKWKKDRPGPGRPKAASGFSFFFLALLSNDSDDCVIYSYRFYTGSIWALLLPPTVPTVIIPNFRTVSSRHTHLISFFHPFHPFLFHQLHTLTHSHTHALTKLTDRGDSTALNPIHRRPIPAPPCPFQSFPPLLHLHFHLHFLSFLNPRFCPPRPTSRRLFSRSLFVLSCVPGSRSRSGGYLSPSLHLSATHLSSLSRSFLILFPLRLIILFLYSISAWIPVPNSPSPLPTNPPESWPFSTFLALHTTTPHVVLSRLARSFVSEARLSC